MRVMTRILGAVAILLFAGLSLPAQTPATNRVMREKLLHAQRTLEALMTSDYAQLATETAALEALTRERGWAVLQNERYVRYSETFRRAVAELTDAAQMRDGDDAMRAYVSATMACYSCHRYLKDSRIAK